MNERDKGLIHARSNGQWHARLVSVTRDTERAAGPACLGKLSRLCAHLLIFASLSVSAAEINGPLPRPLPLFPRDNWWNQDVTWAPVDENSDWYIQYINTPDTKRLHPALGGDVCPGCDEIYAIPYITVEWWQPKVAVQFDYASESDGVDHSTGQSYPFYPIPEEVIWQAHWMQGGWPGRVDHRWDNDRHILIVDRDNNYLYELWWAYFDEATWQWHAGAGVFFDMNTNNRRPEGWASAIAAGMAMLPGLIRYDEVYGDGEIEHALIVNTRDTSGYVYPASHRAGSAPGALPLGARLRLKPWTDISYFPPECQKIFRAMKQYGLILTDNGVDMMIGGLYDPRWNNDLMNPCFHGLTGWDFEVLQLGWRP